ncbi:MAG: hypothetical protein ACJ798_01075 [Phenylobacterium sp.]
MGKTVFGWAAHGRTSALGLGLALQLLAAAPICAGGYRPPHDAFGHPDLQGIWSASSLTPVARPSAFKTLTASPAEAKAYEQASAGRVATLQAPLASKDLAPPSEGEPTDDQNILWDAKPRPLMRINGQIRTSWIVEPADGKIPLNEATRTAAAAFLADELHRADSAQERPYADRCLLGAFVGPPNIQGAMQILQTRDEVVLSSEVNHELRIVRMTGRRHAPAAIRRWLGDSIGWWEGATLVVDTTNFNRGEFWHRPTPNAPAPLSEGGRTVERFTRTGPTEILYAFEIEDPASYTQTWRGEAVLNPEAGPIYEDACHEGNYGLPNILAGARHEEAMAKAGAGPAASKP